MVAPLEGIRIIEVGYYAQVPLAMEFLAEFGAEIIKIEQPGIGDPARGLVKYGGIPTALKGGSNFLFEQHNPGKKSIAVNLQTQAGKEIVYKLVAKSDVFATNLRQKAAKKLALDYETLIKYRSKLIYIAGTGYGSRGPESDHVAIDTDAQARIGRMTSLIEKGAPPVFDFSAPADIMAATLLAYGTVLALVAREKYGVGQIVESSVMAGALNLERVNITAALLAGRQLQSHRRNAPSNPLYNSYQCKDGKWIILTMLQSDRYWVEFCQAIGKDDLIGDLRFIDWTKRDENSAALVSILDDIFRTKNRAYWIKALRASDLGISAVNSVIEACNDQQVRANEYIVKVDHPRQGDDFKLVGPLIQMSKTPGQIRSPAPALGMHTEEILRDMGYGDNEIDCLRRDGVI